MLDKEGIESHAAVSVAQSLCVYLLSQQTFCFYWSVFCWKKKNVKTQKKKIYFASVAVLLLSARGCEILEFSSDTPGKKKYPKKNIFLTIFFPGYWRNTRFVYVF